MQVEYGCYLGYFPAGARESYKAVCGQDELEDRLESYKKGQVSALRMWGCLVQSAALDLGLSLKPEASTRSRGSVG